MFMLMKSETVGSCSYRLQAYAPLWPVGRKVSGWVLGVQGCK